VVDMSSDNKKILLRLQKQLDDAKTPMQKKAIQDKIVKLQKRLSKPEIGKSKIGDNPRNLLKPFKSKKSKKKNSIISQISQMAGKYDLSPSKEYLGESSWNDFGEGGGFEGGGNLPALPDFIDFNKGGLINKKIKRACLRGGRNEKRGT